MTQDQRDFILHLGELAVADMHRTGVPASLTVAQAILESNWGKSALTVKANALFGIKAAGSWTGKTHTMQTTEYIGGKQIITTAAFRAYGSWSDSIADHSALLTGLPRYKDVIGEQDYRAACKAIKKAGYATDPDYDVKLINLIELYKLSSYDFAAPSGVAVSIGGRVFHVNAKNVDGHWNIIMDELGGLKIKLRALLEMMGYEVSWDEATKTIKAKLAS